MGSFKFFEAVLNDELPISKAWAEEGWPQLLYPFFLAHCQLQNGSENARKAFTLGMGQDISRGKLPSVRQRIPWFTESSITEPHVCAQDFAAWLAARDMEPSPLIAEWFEETGVTPKTPAPEEKPLTTRERNTLLAIIAALCKEAKIDYTKPAKAAGQILHTAGNMGLQIGETTIERHLKKIPDALGSRMK